MQKGSSRLTLWEATGNSSHWHDTLQIHYRLAVGDFVYQSPMSSKGPWRESGVQKRDGCREQASLSLSSRL
jgi:hypothetical protein